MRRLWLWLRTMTRPLPRPGVVLAEGWTTPPSASPLPDPCDCDAWGTEKEHRGETWSHSSDFVPDFKVRHAACPRWRPSPVQRRAMKDLRRNAFDSYACDCTGAPHAAEEDCPPMRIDAFPGAVEQMWHRRSMLGALLAGEDEAATLSRSDSRTDEERSALRMGGMVVKRPEASVVIRSPMPPYDPSLRVTLPK